MQTTQIRSQQQYPGILIVHDDEMMGFALGEELWNRGWPIESVHMHVNAYRVMNQLYRDELFRKSIGAIIIHKGDVNGTTFDNFQYEVRRMHDGELNTVRFCVVSGEVIRGQIVEKC